MNDDQIRNVEGVFDAIRSGELLDVREIGHALVDQMAEPWGLKTFSDLAYRAYVVRELTSGMQDLDAGQTFTQEEVERRILGTGNSEGSAD